MEKKEDSYVEMEIYSAATFSIEKLRDLLNRADASGLTEVDVEIDHGWYGEIDGVTLRISKKT